MANSSVRDRIRARVETFAAELSTLIRASAMETVRDALGGSGGRGMRGLELKSLRGGRRPKGQKRDPAEIEKLTGKLLDYTRGHAGQRIEQIATGMGVTTKELNLPVKKLIAQKSLRTRGQKRATQYYAR